MSKIFSLVRHPDRVLRMRSLEVDEATLRLEATQELIDDMITLMWQEDGVGLAAPQIGQGLRIVIITRGREAIPLINPIIVFRSLRKNTMEEGCLSVPGFYGTVRRSTIVHARARGRKGEVLRFRAHGLEARIVQHEVDHLDGILFIDRAKRVIPANTAAKL